jgi:DNA-binding CsgD family transcriptional regulator
VRGPRGITDLQAELLDRIAQGRCDKEIACEMQVSYRTVRTHIERLFLRFAVHNRAALAVRWREGELRSKRGTDSR